jgi:DNA-binding FadR family transcriptional regulator
MAAPGGESHRFGAVTSRTLSQRITKEIITSILQGHYSPGELLPTEEELSRQMGVSRSVVREAAKAVSMLGMIEPRQGRGTIVLPAGGWNEFAPEILEARRDLNLMDEFLLDLLEVRRIIEVEAAGLAARIASEEDLHRIEGRLKEMEDLGDDAERFARADVEFHDGILVATGNRPLRQLLRSIEPALLAARKLSLTSGADRLARSVREHRTIYQAIAARSPQRAKRAMAAHLSWTADLSLDDDGLVITGGRKQQRRRSTPRT